MIERLVENWLDRSSETSFQTPFCYMLASQGYAVVHLTRHCALEMGKDVIALAPDGTPCAYQLKGGASRQITLSQWDSEGLGPQLFKLVHQAISHPSMPDKPHHSFFVTNRELEEDVWRAIEDLQKCWKQNGMTSRHFKTMTRGELLALAKNLGADLWPSELTDARDLLQLFLLPGDGPLPKDKFASLVEETIGLQLEKTSNPDACRRLSSAALITAIAVSSFAKKANHVAEIEAWTIYLASLCASVERRGLVNRDYRTEMDIARDAIVAKLGALAKEVHKRSSDGFMGLTEGNAAIDFTHFFYRGRITIIMGYLATLVLLHMANPDELVVGDMSFEDFKKWLGDFIRSNRRFMLFWGESATPHWLAVYWFLNAFGRPQEDDSLLLSVIQGIYEANRDKKSPGLPSVYQSVEEALEGCNGMKAEGLPQSLRRQTYVLEGLFQLFVRLNYKQAAKGLWPEYTQFLFRSYEVDEPWKFFRWRNEKTGNNTNKMQQRRQKWEDVKRVSIASDDAAIPQVIRDYPELVLLLVQVYPHRLNSAVMRWLDTALAKRRREMPNH